MLMTCQNKFETMKRSYKEPQMTERQIELMKQSIDKAKIENRKKSKLKKRWFGGAVAVAALATFCILPNTSPKIAYAMEQIPLLGNLVKVVTIHEYQHDDNRNHINIEVSEIVPENTDQLPADTATTLHQSAEEINMEIREITENFLVEFEKHLKDEEGYQDVGVTSEVVNTTAEYFTLKVICYQASGSGTQWNYYYTIDLTTGERLELAALFTEGADYITPISENIKVQMAEQMEADESVYYWLHDEIEGWNFKAITDETAFYVNENGNIVISFNEGEVAPMYMGVVTFEIPAEVVENIRK